MMKGDEYRYHAEAKGAKEVLDEPDFLYGETPLCSKQSLDNHLKVCTGIYYLLWFTLRSSMFWLGYFLAFET